MKALWALLLGGCLCAPALAQEVTLSLEFFYGSTKVAEVTDALTLSPDRRHYQLKSHAAAVGLAKFLHGDSTFYSSGRVDKTHGLLMTLYTQQRGHRPPQRAELAENGQLLLQRGEETRSETVALPLFDYLSAVYRSYMLGRPAGGMLKFTNGWRLVDYDYIVQGSETVSTGMGDIEAVLISRTSSRGERKMWLAPSLGYLPVRLYVNDKGHEFTTVLKEVEK